MSDNNHAGVLMHDGRIGVDNSGRSVIRGELDPEHYQNLVLPDYQREIIPERVEKIADALLLGKTMPEVLLAARGHDYQTFGSTDSDDISVRDNVYIIDGSQRMAAAREVWGAANVNAHQAALLFLDTTESWEREQFWEYNFQRTPVSPNIHLRNYRHDYPVIQMLYDLSHDPEFPLYDRVTWQQRARVGELVTALGLLKATSGLHDHIQHYGFQVQKLAVSAQKVYQEIGQADMRANIMYFYDLIEETWGLRDITYREQAVQIRQSFMTALAQTFADHPKFWKNDERTLWVDVTTRRKLSDFNLQDPHVRELSRLSSGGTTSTMLYQLIVERLNHKMHYRNRLQVRQA